jgi:hypothetical protein
MCDNLENECVQLRVGGCCYEVDLNEGVAKLTGPDFMVSGAFEVPRSVEGFVVTGIADRAFMSADKLSSITIPECVLDIGDDAFSCQHTLSAIHVSGENPRYRSLDGVLFDKERRRLIQCPPFFVKEVYEVPAGVTEIADYAFSGCVLMTGIHLPDGLKRIGDRVFMCSGITSIDIPVSVIEITDDAFSHSDKLSAIRVENGNEKFCSRDGVLFNKGLTMLKHIPGNWAGVCTIPASVTDIYGETLVWSSGLTAFHVEEGSESYTSLDGVLFSKDIGELLSVPRAKAGICRVPASVKTIASSAFLGCSGLTGFEVDEGNTCFCSVDGVLFSNDMCELLRFPPTKTGVCKVPASVTKFHYMVYPECYRVMGFEVDDGNTCFRSVDGVLYSKDMKKLIRCPAAREGYFRVPDGVEDIDSSAFSFCGLLTGIRFSASVKNIDQLVFWGGHFLLLEAFDVDEGNSSCRSVDGVLFNKDMTELIRCPVGRAGTYRIPTTVKSIVDFAFDGCVKLDRIEVPKSVEEVGLGVWDEVVGEIVHEAG